jgi:hypothetical protein
VPLLCSPGREEWRALVIGDLSDAPVVVHQLPGCADPIRLGRARAQAWRQCRRPFVALVDDDDRVRPGAIEACLAALQAHPRAVGAYTSEEWIDETGAVVWTPTPAEVAAPWSLSRHISDPLHMHHVWVARRSIVQRHALDAARYPCRVIWALTALMSRDGPWVHVPMVGYQWRLHDGGVHLHRSPELRDVVRSVSGLLARR